MLHKMSGLILLPGLLLSSVFSNPVRTISLLFFISICISFIAILFTNNVTVFHSGYTVGIMRIILLMLMLVGSGYILFSTFRGTSNSSSNNTLKSNIPKNAQTGGRKWR